jgi:hypothetical protein
MNDTVSRDRLIIARLALVLFIIGLLVPLLIAALNVALSRQGGAAAETAGLRAIGFGFVCEILALVLGIIGRRHVSWKVGMMGGGVTLGLAVVIMAGVLF